MNRTGKTKMLLRKIYQGANDAPDSTAMDERILSDASESMKQATAANRRTRHIFRWREFMRTRTAKLTTAAAVLVAALVFTTWDRLGGTAWSFEQTIAAMKQLRSLQIKGSVDYWSQKVGFKCWIRCPDQESEPGSMRFECDWFTMVASLQDENVYFYWPRENFVLITNQGYDIDELKFWYRAAKIGPWLPGQMVETLKLFTDDWKQVVKKDPADGKEQVHVTCSYRPSNSSISFVVDTDSKLIKRAKMWMNLQQEGEPQFDAQSIVYNEDLPDELFEFQIPEGATVANQEDIREATTLSTQAESLFHKENKYAEAMELYLQVHKKCPRLNIAVEALMMVGLCQRRLGEYDKEIETYEAAIKEYSARRGLGGMYFYLGRAYMDKGQNQKALEAFENCLASNKGISDQDKFPLKDAREYITKIKGD